MASIRERTGPRGTTWAVLYRDDGRQTSRTFTTRKAAQAFAARVEVLGASAAGRVLAAETRRDPETVPTVAEVVAAHIDSLEVEPGTVRNYRTYLAQITDHPLGSMPLDVAERADVARWIADQEAAGSAEKTIRNRHALLSAALGRAVDDGLTTRNVARRARITRRPHDEMVWLTPAEFDVLLSRVSAFYRPLVMWLYGTGMRFGEATALQVGDLHLEQTPVTVTVTRAWKRGVIGAPKTDAGRRTLSVPGPVVEAVRPLLDRPSSALLFVNTQGARIKQATFHDSWQGWVRDYDLRGGQVTRRTPALGKVPRVHDLRHSHASAMLAAGITLFDLSRRLGHSSIKVTADIYGHLAPEAQVQAERAAALTFLSRQAQITAG